MALYIVAGLFGRDPWKTDDVVGFSSMLSTLEHHHWLTAYLDLTPLPENGPLTSIMGGFFIAIFSPFFEGWNSPLDAQILASRLPNLIYFFTMLWGVWYSTYLLARRPETQPLPLPFGGEPLAKDYGRMLADVAFLLFIATVGVIIRLHETSFFPLIMAIHSIAFYGFVRMLDHPTQAFIVIGLMLLAAFLTRGLVGLAPLVLVSIALFFTKIYTPRHKIFLALAMLLAALLGSVWLASVYTADYTWFKLWLSHSSHVFSVSHWLTIPVVLRDLAWFLWPSWPFALLAIWNWRHWFDKAHIFIPFVFICANLILIFSTDHAFEPEYGPLTIGCVVLAAMSIPTLKRRVMNLLDWYSIMVVSLTLTTIWLGWIALHLGWPSQINHNIMRLIKGFEPSINWLAVFIAMVICVLWTKLIHWRLNKNPKAMWRGIVLSATGITGVWFLLTTLWLPAIDYHRSYRNTAESLATAINQHVSPKECISAVNTGMGQMAAFYAFAHLNISPKLDCRFVFLQTTENTLSQKVYAYKGFGDIIWKGQRRSERHGELFLLIDLKPNHTGSH